MSGASSVVGVGPLVGDEPVEPGEVVGEGRVVALAQRSRRYRSSTPVAGTGAVPSLRSHAASSSARRRSNSVETLVGSRIAAERDPQGEGAVVGDGCGSVEQRDEVRLAPSGDAVDLLAPSAPGRRRCARARNAASSPASEPLIGTGRTGAGVGLDGLDQAGPLEAGERRIQRPERHRAGPRAGQLGEPLAQLVAVEVLLLEEPEDGEVDHQAASIADRHIESMYDVSVACSGRRFAPASA